MYDFHIASKRYLTIGGGPPTEIGIFSKRALEPLLESPQFIDDLPPNEEISRHKSDTLEALIGYDAVALGIGGITLNQPLKADNSIVLEVLVGIRQPMNIRFAIVVGECEDLA